MLIRYRGKSPPWPFWSPFSLPDKCPGPDHDGTQPFIWGRLHAYKRHFRALTMASFPSHNQCFSGDICPQVPHHTARAYRGIGQGCGPLEKKDLAMVCQVDSTERPLGVPGCVPHESFCWAEYGKAISSRGKIHHGSILYRLCTVL